jgi:hypothetical protein
MGHVAERFFAVGQFLLTVSLAHHLRELNHAIFGGTGAQGSGKNKITQNETVATAYHVSRTR